MLKGGHWDWHHGHFYLSSLVSHTVKHYKDTEEGEIKGSFFPSKDLTDLVCISVCIHRCLLLCVLGDMSHYVEATVQTEDSPTSSLCVSQAHTQPWACQRRSLMTVDSTHGWLEVQWGGPEIKLACCFAGCEGVTLFLRNLSKLVCFLCYPHIIASVLSPSVSSLFSCSLCLLFDDSGVPMFLNVLIG